MSRMSMSKYVRVGMKIDFLFVNPDVEVDDVIIDDDVVKSTWCEGKIKNVRRYGTEYSTHDKYVEVDILFDDGEYVKRHRLYDSDYCIDDENIENTSWRFSGVMQELINDLYTKVKDYEENEDILDDPDYNESDCDLDSGSEYEEDHENETNVENQEMEQETDDETSDNVTMLDIVNKVNSTSMFNMVLAFTMTVFTIAFLIHVSVDQLQRNQDDVCTVYLLE